MQVAPGTAACKPPHHWFIPGNALSPELRDRAALYLLGPAQRLHGAIHQKDERPWSWERASNRRNSNVTALFFLAPEGVLSSWSTGGEPGEGSVSRQSRGPAPPPPAQPASLFLAFWPNPPGEAPGKDKAIKLMKHKSICKRLDFKTERGLVDKGESCRMFSSMGQYCNISEVSVSCSIGQHSCIYKMPYKIKISPTK